MRKMLVNDMKAGRRAGRGDILAAAKCKDRAKLARRSKASDRECYLLCIRISGERHREISGAQIAKNCRGRSDNTNYLQHLLYSRLPQFVSGFITSLDTELGSNT